MTYSFDFIYITNLPILGSFIAKNGVRWVMVDLEHIGKIERQKGRDTVISAHTISDVENMRLHLNSNNLLVRINPIGGHSKQEIENVIAAGADAIMLPFFKTTQEIRAFVEMVNSRCKVFLLLETLDGIRILSDILSVEGIDFIHIGLNDLHIERKTKFMFEFMADGSIDPIASLLRSKQMKFGIGGISRYGKLSPPAESVLTEHIRLGSCGTILSRSFMDTARMTSIQEFSLQFRVELEKLSNHLFKLTDENSCFFETNKKYFAQKVAEVVAKINEK